MKLNMVWYRVRVSESGVLLPPSDLNFPLPIPIISVPAPFLAASALLCSFVLLHKVFHFVLFSLVFHISKVPVLSDSLSIFLSFSASFSPPLGPPLNPPLILKFLYLLVSNHFLISKMSTISST